MCLGHLRQLVRLSRAHAAHLYPDGAMRPILKQRFNDIEVHSGGWEHGDHTPTRPGTSLGAMAGSAPRLSSARTCSQSRSQATTPIPWR